MTHYTSSVSALGTATLTCVVTDPDGDPPSFDWYCSAGQLSSKTTQSVTWTAPLKSGTVIIGVYASDDKGASDTLLASTTVTPVSTTLWNWDGSVTAGYYTYNSGYIPAGYTVSGSFYVDALDISFWIMDAANFAVFQSGQSASAIWGASRSSGTSFSAIVPTSDTYYFVLDNRYSLFTDKSAHVIVEATTP